MVPRQTVDGVMRMRRRRAVPWHSAAGTHAADNAGMMRVMRMMGRWEHGETVVERNHFRFDRVQKFVSNRKSKNLEPRGKIAELDRA